MSISRLIGLLAACLPALATLPAHAEKTVRLAAQEQPPYIGQQLANQGYVAELVRAALKETGYRVDIRFYPAARARSLAAGGQVDGFLPATADTSLTTDFRLSSPFPGANVGLLKKRGTAVTYPPAAPKSPVETLRNLRQYRFGAVRGSSLAAEFDGADFLRKEYVATDLQNLDKLALAGC